MNYSFEQNVYAFFLKLKYKSYFDIELLNIAKVFLTI